MTKPISSRVASMPLSSIKKMELMASEIEGSVSLAQGIPSFRDNKAIHEVIHRALDMDIVDNYSLVPGILPFREEIAQTIFQETGQHYDPGTEIIATTGAMEALCASIITLIEPGDEVILLTPTYPSYFNQIRMIGGVPVEVPLVEEEGWDIDLKAIEAAITPKTKVLLLCYPNNPTGSLYNLKKLKKVVELVINNNLYLIVDEVYKYFIYDRSYQYFFLAQLSQLRKNLITIYGLSKTYSLTGWRIGYLYADKSLTKHILKVHDTLVTCAPVISQYAGLAALKGGLSEFYDGLASIKRRRDYLCDELKKTNLFSFQIPGGSYYLLARMNETIIQQCEVALSASPAGTITTSQLFCEQLLKQTGVNLVPGSAFGKISKNHVRFCFARKEEDVKEVVRRLKTGSEVSFIN